MSTALVLLGLIIASAPIAIVLHWPMVTGFVAAAAAVTVAITALRIRPGEAQFFLKIIFPVVLVATIPCVWMIVQCLPLQSTGLAHPIWASAAVPLGRPITGSVSIDPGATVLSLAKYLSTLAISFVASALAIDRLRAKWLFFLVTMAVTLTSLIVLLENTGYVAVLRGSDWPLRARIATDCAGIGIILTTAAGVRAFDRNTSPYTESAWSRIWIWPDVLEFPIGLLLCVLAFVVGAEKSAYVAVAGGLATFAVVAAIRRYSLGSWGIAAIAATASLIAITILVFEYGGQPFDFTIAFASAPSELLTTTQRLLSDTGWLGTGAGSFSAILPIYGIAAEILPEAPTAAAKIVVEMGQPFYWLVLVAVFSLFVVLLRGGWRRQRDSVFSTAGASCLVTLTLLAYFDANLFHTPVLIIAATTIGLAVAQSRSRLI